MKKIITFIRSHRKILKILAIWKAVSISISMFLIAYDGEPSSIWFWIWIVVLSILSGILGSLGQWLSTTRFIQHKLLTILLYIPCICLPFITCIIVAMTLALIADYYNSTALAKSVVALVIIIYVMGSLFEICSLICFLTDKEYQSLKDN